VVSQGKLCIKGKYGFDFVDADDRLRIPRIRKSFLEKNPDIKEAVSSALVDFDDTWYECDLDGATTAAAMKLKAIQKKYGRKSVASIGGARSSCESSYLFQKFTRHTLNSPHVDNCARVCHSPSLKGMRATIGEGAATNPYNDIYNSEFMIVIGSNTTEAHPIIANRILDVARESDNLLIAVAEGGTITLKNYFTNTQAGVETLHTAQGDINLSREVINNIQTPWWPGIYRAKDNQDHLISGTEHINYLKGNSGNDIIIGGNRFNWLKGSAGNDLLVGGSSTDRLDGNEGNDNSMVMQVTIGLMGVVVMIPS